MSPKKRNDARPVFLFVSKDKEKKRLFGNFMPGNVRVNIVESIDEIASFEELNDLNDYDGLAFDETLVNQRLVARLIKELHVPYKPFFILDRYKKQTPNDPKNLCDVFKCQHSFHIPILTSTILKRFGVQQKRVLVAGQGVVWIQEIRAGLEKLGLEIILVSDQKTALEKLTYQTGSTPVDMLIIQPRLLNGDPEIGESPHQLLDKLKLMSAQYRPEIIFATGDSEDVRFLEQYGINEHASLQHVFRYIETTLKEKYPPVTLF